MPPAVFQRWRPHLEPFEMRLGDVLYEPGRKLSQVYFPTTGAVSLLYILESGACAEVAAVGNEGIVGVSGFLGGQSTPSQAVVQSSGLGLRLPLSTLKRDFEAGGAATQLLLRYTQALMTQIAQTAVCNRHHRLDQRLCRLLLVSLDRQHSHELQMTQTLIANMLGVRREGVTEAAINLQSAGLIQYSRGHIAVLDRPGLVQRSCECYAVVKREYGRLLPAVEMGSTGE